jgi:hypothetical protein
MVSVCLIVQSRQSPDKNRGKPLKLNHATRHTNYHTDRPLQLLSGRPEVSASAGYVTESYTLHAITHTR